MPDPSGHHPKPGHEQILRSHNRADAAGGDRLRLGSDRPGERTVDPRGIDLGPLAGRDHADAQLETLSHVVRTRAQPLPELEADRDLDPAQPPVKTQSEKRNEHSRVRSRPGKLRIRT